MAKLITEMTVDAQSAAYLNITLLEALAIRIAGTRAIKAFVDERVRIAIQEAGQNTDLMPNIQGHPLAGLPAEQIGEYAWAWIEHKARLSHIPLKLEAL